MGESILHLEDEPFMGENAPKSMRAHVRESFALVKTVFVHWLCCWSHFSEGNHPEILKKHKSNPKKSQGNPKTFTKKSNFFQKSKNKYVEKSNFFLTNLKQIVQKSRKLLWNKKSLMNPRCPCPSLPPPPPLCCHYPSPPHHRRQFFWEKNKTTLTY